MKSTFIVLLATSLNSAWACPGSPATMHASCEMSLYFPNTSCDKVAHEIDARGRHKKQWKDPHNNGKYSIEVMEKQEGGDKYLIEGSRLTGDEMYTDKFDFEMENDLANGGCKVKACSESQVTSVLDFSTNYCNLKMLICTPADGCTAVDKNYGGEDFVYEETHSYFSCPQRSLPKCFSGTALEL